jgi:hypothetical protein
MKIEIDDSQLVNDIVEKVDDNLEDSATDEK